MRINFKGRLSEEPEIRAGFIGCGSHSFRNIYPTFQFAPVRLVATCDLDGARAAAFAAKFGAERSYSDYQEMIEKEELDAVFVVTNYDEEGRPRFPSIAVDCLDHGLHVWIEKPPAATCGEIEAMQQAARRSGGNVVVGMKKMFFPANEKAKLLMDGDDFGTPVFLRLEYPQYVPTVEELRRYLDDRQVVRPAMGFLDHLCHPVALLLFLMGMPETLYYERGRNGSGIAVFTYTQGAIATLAFTNGAAARDGMERTVIISESQRHIVVENNTRVSYHRIPSPGYGDVPDFYGSGIDESTVIWEPEFSLGQLYNKGLFLLGYYNEVNEFARSILEKRSPAKGTLTQAWQATRIFEAFAEGPGRRIALGGGQAGA